MQRPDEPGLRIVFAGSPDAASPSLLALAASHHDLVAVVTRGDAPRGRKRVLTPTAVGAEAAALGLPTIKANRLDARTTGEIAALEPDLGVIVAYGGLVREPLLSVPRLGWINLHFSLLPRWRGAAPVQHAIMAGDSVTGAAVFQLVPELDAGDVYATVEAPIGANQTGGNLLAALAQSGAVLLLRVVSSIAAGTARPMAQSGPVTFAPKLTLDDGRVDWSRDAGAVHARIRGVTPEPGAFTTIGGERLKILDSLIAHDSAPLAPGRLVLSGGRVLVGTSTGPLELVRVLPAGRTAMAAADWWRGRPPHAPEIADGAGERTG